jgi:PAS domain S-box-containing protein
LNFWRFEYNDELSVLLVTGEYNLSLVFTSVVIACFACFSALHVADHTLSSSNKLNRSLFITLGALAMGCGIWAMHFTGMLAYSMPEHVGYSLPITLISVIPAIIGSGIALFLLSHKEITLARNQTAAFFLATCIALMHYTGMEAMEMNAELRYDFWLFILSYVVAHLLASIALAVKYINIERYIGKDVLYKNLFSAILMGCAISGMHYTAMAAARFYHYGNTPVPAHDLINHQFLISTVIAIVITLTIITFVSTNLFRLFEKISQKLIESESALNTFTNSSPVMMWVMDENGHPKQFNNAWLSFTGHSLDEEIEHSWSGDEINEKDRLACFQTYEKHFKQRTSFEHEYRLRRHDGQFRWIREVGMPFFGVSHKFMGFIGNCSDITERKKVEFEVNALRHYLNNIIDSMPSILIGVDEKAKVTQWNREATKATGIPAIDAKGQPVTQAFPRLRALEQDIHTAILSRQEKYFPKQKYQTEGMTVYLDITIYPLLSDGVNGAVIRVDNVTDKVQIEEMMIQSEKMLSVGGLAAGMAHEINNPLAGMLQTASVMKNRLSLGGAAANEKVAAELGIEMGVLNQFMEQRGIFRMLDALTDSGSRIADIVENVLSFSRQENAETSDTDINQLLDKTIELSETDYDLKKEYDFRNISVIKQYSDKLPNLSCEASKLQQVFLNLIRNASQAMQEAKTLQPRITITTALAPQQDAIIIEIADNGPGMPEDIRKRVFEPFFSTKPVGTGTGLGLSVSYFIITENHDGEMSVESELGRGTTFRVKLPISR